MTNLSYRTKGNSSPKGKPKVYFTCHPGDFSTSFEKICNDIFKTHDCAIFYCSEPDTDVPKKDLEQMSLFVVPISFKLLSTPNRAMDSDILYAKEHNYPILPILIESGIDSLYSLPKNFGARQYLNPYSKDMSEISYEKKLEKSSFFFFILPLSAAEVSCK